VFSDKYLCTIGVDFIPKVVMWNSTTRVRLQFWDIAGQERFGHMTRMYYKGAVGAVVVYDVSREHTFKAVEKWKANLDEALSTPEASIPAILLANKCDMIKNYPIDKAQMMTFCQEHGFSNFFETSAKEDLNIQEAFKFLVGRIIEKDPDVLQNRERRIQRDSFVLSAYPTPIDTPVKTGGCC